MPNRMSLRNSLIEVDRSVLIVIDVQEFFLVKLPVEQREPLVNRIVWLSGVAAHLDVPLVVTAEDIPKLGSVVPAITEKLPSGSRVHNKMVFGLADDQEILTAVKDTGRDVPLSDG